MLYEANQNTAGRVNFRLSDLGNVLSSWEKAAQIGSKRTLPPPPPNAAAWKVAIWSKFSGKNN